MSARIVFISGTDTGVGKTVVGVAIARGLKEAGVDVIAIKPVESGCGVLPESEQDGVRLAAATGQLSPRTALTRLRAPVAPTLAAKMENQRLDQAVWYDAIEAASATAEVVLIEGAGGLLSPLADGLTARDMARRLAADVIVVCADKLGVLNHLALTTEALEREGLKVFATFFVAPDVPDASTGTNASDRAPGIIVRVPRIARPFENSGFAEPVVSALASRRGSCS